MNAKIELCKIVSEHYPDVGQCCIEAETAYDKDDRYWVVHLKRGNQSIKHFLPPKDAEFCMQGKQCLNLGIEMNQYHCEIGRVLRME